MVVSAESGPGTSQTGRSNGQINAVPRGRGYDVRALVRPLGGKPTGRKVRARQDKVVGNPHPPAAGEGKCHRKYTANPV